MGRGLAENIILGMGWLKTSEYRHMIFERSHKVDIA